MKSVVIAFTAYLYVVSGDQIVASFNDTLELMCGYPSPARSYSSWIFYNKYRGNRADFLIEQAGESGPPFYGSNITADRVVSWDYSTGYLAISQLTCWEDQRYICDMDSQTNISHEVRLGAPADTPHVSIHIGVTTVKLEAGQECEGPLELPGTYEADIIIESSVLSRPAVDFSINGENMSRSCSPDGMCADAGEVRCEISETYTLNFMERYLRITIKYKFLDPWKFCIEFLPLTSTSLSTASGGSGGKNHTTSHSMIPSGLDGEKRMTTLEGNVHTSSTTPDREEVGSTGSNNNGFSFLKMSIPLILIFL